ncbi:MAG: alanine--tRNA ligase, partial [Chitinophagaceae bacterium]|nr:alanine--tRNA ligase [Chitinophagaceae bacterium]
RLIASENQLSVDESGFEKEMQEQKNRSRAATTIDTEDWVILNQSDKTSFTGYHHLEAETEVLKYRKIKAKGKTQYQVVLATTPFYAESGGQVGDKGTLQFGEEQIAVTDTKKENELIIHFIEKLPADITLPVVARVNAETRLLTTYNHTATHLLHAALRQVLGRHVAQKGSLVSPAELRFDFSHFSKVTDEELLTIQMLVNEKIRENIPVVIKELPKDEALQLGAMALFGEKYGDMVRVVIIDPSYSIELCGGTHVANTGMIGLFSINAESAVAAGVRRIEAQTGPGAFQYHYERLTRLKQIGELLKSGNPLQTVEKLLEERNALQKKIEGLESRHWVQIRNELLQKDEIINGVTFIGDIIEVSNPDALKKICFDVKNNLRDYVMVLAANIGGKPHVAIGMSEVVSEVKQLDAAKIIREHIAPLIKGGGGGQKTLATAGGQDPSQLRQAIASVKALL